MCYNTELKSIYNLLTTNDSSTLSVVIPHPLKGPKYFHKLPEMSSFSNLCNFTLKPNFVFCLQWLPLFSFSNARLSQSWKNYVFNIITNCNLDIHILKHVFKGSHHYIFLSDPSVCNLLLHFPQSHSAILPSSNSVKFLT